ncbi:MAG: MalY/PatB family protein, partial [Bacilli bacterium]
NEITNEFQAFIGQGDFGYFDIEAPFTESIQHWYEKRHSVSIPKDWLLPGIGTITSIHFALGAVHKRGTKACIFTPVYGPFRDVILNNDIELVTEPLTLSNGQYRIDFESLAKTIVRENVGTIVLCNPHNPSGRVWTAAELEQLVVLCEAHDVLLVSDEVHSDIVIGEKCFTTVATFADRYDRILVSSSPNKTFNLAGLQASYLVVPNAAMRQQVTDTFTKHKIGTNRVGYAFLCACYTQGAAWVDALCVNIAENVDLVVELGATQGITVMQPEAGYLVWLHLDGVTDTDAFVQQLAQQTGVLVEGSGRFVGGEEGYIRLNVATSKALLTEALSRLGQFYNTYQTTLEDKQ